MTCHKECNGTLNCSYIKAKLRMSIKQCELLNSIRFIIALYTSSIHYYIRFLQILSWCDILIVADLLENK